MTARGASPRRRDVAVRLGESELRSGVGIESGVTPAAVDGDGRRLGAVPSARRIIPALSGWASTVLPRTYRSYWSVIQDLSARPGDTASCRTGRAQLDHRVRGRGRLCPSWSTNASCSAGRWDRAPVHRTFVGDGPRRHIHDPLTVPVHLKPTRVGHLADDGGKHLPLGAHGEERVDPVRPDNRAHPLLRLGSEDLFRAHRSAHAAEPCPDRCACRRRRRSRAPSWHTTARRRPGPARQPPDRPRRSPRSTR